MIAKSTEIAEFIVANGLQEPNDPAPSLVLEMFTETHGTVHRPTGKRYTHSDVNNAYKKLRQQGSDNRNAAAVTKASEVIWQVIRMAGHLTPAERQKVIKHLCIEWDLSMP